MDPQSALKSLGLEEKEVSLYLSLLELGEATVLQTAKHAGIKRPTAYVVLENLEKNGFVSRFVRGGKMFFSPQHPQKLLTEAELRMKELKTAMPQFEALFHKKEGKPRVVMYEGKDRLDQAIDEAFVVKGETLFISTLSLSQEVFPRTFRKADYVSFSPEFYARELVDESESSREYAKRVGGPYREIRFIPKEHLPFEMDIGIFGNRTLITSVKKEFFTISIESAEITHAFRTIFNVMWNFVGKE
ncbi:MAG TPA: helix-turn-helix domain-containing protein [Candidatus Paceibacterota bacterium]